MVEITPTIDVLAACLKIDYLTINTARSGRKVAAFMDSERKAFVYVDTLEPVESEALTTELF